MNQRLYIVGVALGSFGRATGTRAVDIDRTVVTIWPMLSVILLAFSKLGRSTKPESG